MTRHRLEVRGDFVQRVLEQAKLFNDDLLGAA